MSDEAMYFVQYTGHDVVTLGKAGTFQNGTGAYVGEPLASLARAAGHFSVSGPFGGTPRVEKKSAADATRAEDEARAKAAPAPLPEAAAPAPKPEPAPAPKAAEAKYEEKKEEAKPAEDKKEEAPKAEAKAPAAAPAAS